jgi:hypothetical protein
MENPQGGSSPVGEGVAAVMRIGRRVWENRLWLAIVTIAVTLLVAQGGISRLGSHGWRAVLAAIAIVLLHAGWRLREANVDVSWPWKRAGQGDGPSITKLVFTLWLVTCLFGVFNYYQFRNRNILDIHEYSDLTYYYLNSKYFDELGYTELYRAMLVADDQSVARFQEIERYRDLTDYERLLPRETAIQASGEVISRFSPERWLAFRADLEFISRTRPAGGWPYFFIDHGYNPPPPWTLVGAVLTNSTPIEEVKWIAMADFVLVAVLFVAIALAFGPEVLLVALAFFLCTFSGRWPVLGSALLRFDWLVALVGAVVCLRRDRHGLAGGLLMYATLNRVFPGIFALPYVVRLVRDTWRRRGLAAEHKRFIAGAVVVLVGIGGGAVAVYGVDAYRDAAINLKLHGSPESYSSHRVGLGDALLYRGERTRRELNDNGGIQGKREQLWDLHPYLRAVGFLAIAFVVVVSWRSRAPVYRLLWLGVFPLFCLTNPQINYYNLRLLLILFHAERWDRYPHKLGLYILFATEVATQGAIFLWADRYAVTAFTSIGMSIYLTVMAAYLIAELRGRARLLD